VNSKEVVWLAKRNGWIEKSQKGSHIKMIHKDKDKPVIIPYHGSKDIPKGTLHEILKDLGLK
jgi:mRNA interferase HicA